MKSEAIPALSIRQPWAELIISGRKPIEIRSWSTRYRGRIWIHAAQHVDQQLDERYGLSNLFRGGFIGSAELSSIEPFDSRRWESWKHRHLDQGPYKSGLFAWILVHPRRFNLPIQAPGQTNLFQLDQNLSQTLVDADLSAMA